MKRFLLVAAALASLPSAAAFRCVDEKGVTHIGDQPPPACAKVPVTETSRSGKVLRRIEPTLTPEQAAAREEENRKRIAQEKVAAEQKRKDLALMSTYGTEKDFDVARDRNTEPLRGRIKTVQDRMKAVDKRIKELEDEMEFYKAGASNKSKGKAKEAPPQLVADLERAKAEKASATKNIADTEREITSVRQKYDADKARWLVLKNNPAERGAAQAAPEPAKAAKK